MASRWHSTKYPGVRYREHSTRAYQNKPDRYFTISVRRDGRLTERGLGWASAGWTPERASIARGELLVNGVVPKEQLPGNHEVEPFEQHNEEPPGAPPSTPSMLQPENVALQELQNAIALLQALQAGTAGVNEPHRET
jgi:hypothetical protein